MTQEWDAFVLCLKKPLPITFRINGQGRFADRLLAQMESNFMKQFTEEPVVVSGLRRRPGELASSRCCTRKGRRPLRVPCM